MNPGSKTPTLLLLFFCAVLAACAAPSGLTKDDYRRKLPSFRAAAADSADAPAQRDYGEALVYTGSYLDALAPLERALTLVPDDPETIYFLGIAREATGDVEGALGLYARSAGARDGSPYLALLDGRYRWLRRESFRQSAEAALTGDPLTARSVTATVTVLPLAYGGGDPRYEAIGRGLSELIHEDLARAGVRVVEQDRLQLALAALALDASEAFAGEHTLRLGRLLRSGRVVGGEVDVREGAVKADVALWDWTRERSPTLYTREGSLDALFELKDQIVADLLGRLRLSPSTEAPAAPTQSIEAFLAFSAALVAEDAGRYTEAADRFTEAATVDPGFALAASRAEAATRIADQVGDLDAALEIALALAPPPEAPALVGSRLARLGGNVGVHVVPSGEGREPGEDTPFTTTLPPPPPPPSNQN